MNGFETMKTFPSETWGEIKMGSKKTQRGSSRVVREAWILKAEKKLDFAMSQKTGKEIVNKVQEAQRIPGRVNPRKNIPRHIVIKLTKIQDKDKILEATREKQQITYKGSPTRFLADFLAETLQARRE